MKTKPTIIPLAGHVFEDTIDGYFPLQESLKQMMKRQGFSAAVVSLNFAPAMDIPNLAHEDPVPLYVTDGFGCMINHMTLVVRHIGDKVEVEGLGDWKWFDGPLIDTPHFSPLHRLAEPAFIKGVGFRRGEVDTKLLGHVEEGSHSPQFALLGFNKNDNITCDEVLKPLGWSTARIMLKSSDGKTIDRDETLVEASMLQRIDGAFTCIDPSSDFIICRDDKGLDRGSSFLIEKHWRLFAP
ncbi:MAG: hypothetical protein ABJO30_10755 [Hyphomicrobiales bacterium]